MGRNGCLGSRFFSMIGANSGVKSAIMHANNYQGVVEVISDLQLRGFCWDYSVAGDKLLCAQEKCYLSAGEFKVLETYSFEIRGRKNKTIAVCAIEPLDRPWKGILLYQTLC
jgi:hypothetical protein